jgi:hypothetical protein
MTYFGKYPASGNDQVVGLAWTTILSLAQTWNHTEDNFGVWDIEIQNNGARDVTGLEFRHSIDMTNYSAYPDISDDAALAIVPYLTAGSKVRLRLFIPVGILRIRATTSAADGAILTYFERSEVSYYGATVDGKSISELLAAGAVAPVSALGVASMPYKSLMTLTHEYGLEDMYFNTNVVNAGAITHEDDLSAAELSVTIADTDAAHMQSKERFRFQLGSEMVFKFEFLMGAGLEDNTKKIGIFDNLDGFFLEQNRDAASTLQFGMRTSTGGAGAVDTLIDQDDWNIDTLQGSGKSGKTLDIEQVQQMFIRFGGQAGYVEFGFFIDGVMCVAHREYIGNGQDVPLASWLTLPVAALIFNTDTLADPTELYVFSWSAGAYGDVSRHNPVRVAATMGVTPTALGATDIAVLAVRPKDGTNYVLGGVAPRGGSLLAEANAKYYWRLVVGGVVGGGWGAAVDLSTGRSEYVTDNVAVVGGVEMANGVGVGHVMLPEFDVKEVLAARGDMLIGDPPENIALEIYAIDALNLYACLDVVELMS